MSTDVGTQFSHKFSFPAIKKYRANIKVNTRGTTRYMSNKLSNIISMKKQAAKSHQLAPLKAITHFYYQAFRSGIARSVRKFM